jgi:hypothetical protein
MYISAPDGMWRLNAFPISENWHSFPELLVHLPDRKSMLFEDSKEKQESSKGTMFEPRWLLAGQTRK